MSCTHATDPDQPTTDRHGVDYGRPGTRSIATLLAELAGAIADLTRERTETIDRLTGERDRARDLAARLDPTSEIVNRVRAYAERVRAEQAAHCVYGTTHGDGRTCDCKYADPNRPRISSEVTGCAERRGFLIGLLAALGDGE